MADIDVELPSPLHVLLSQEYDLRSDGDLWKYRCLEYNIVAESPTPDEVQAVLEVGLAELVHNMKKGAKTPGQAETTLWQRFNNIESEYAIELDVPGYGKKLDALVRHYEPPKVASKVGRRKRKE